MSSPKILKYLNGTAISAFVIPGLLVLVKNLTSNLNELDSSMASFGWSL